MNNKHHSNEQAHHERYKDNTVQPYHQKVTKNFQATSILINGGVINDHVIEDVTGNISHRTITKMLRSTIKTKLDPFKNVVNFSNKTFFRPEFKLLNKNLTSCPPPNK